MFVQCKNCENEFVLSCVTENLVPNIFLELFFVVQLLTSQSAHTHDDDERESLCSVNSGVQLAFLTLVLQHQNIMIFQLLFEFKWILICFSLEIMERCYLRRVHNCVYFAVKVLQNQFQ